MPLFCTSFSGYPGVKGDFFISPYLITSSSFSGMPIMPMKCSISCAKVYPCSSRLSKFKPQGGFVKNLTLSVPASVFYPEKLASAKHYLSLPLKLDYS